LPRFCWRSWGDSLPLGLAQVPSGISGTWKATSSIGNAAERQNRTDLVMVLHQNGDEITGSLGPSADRQIMTISNGKIEGNAVSFDVVYEQGAFSFERCCGSKISIQFRLENGDAEGRFQTSNQQGVTIQGTGTGKVQADRMTFDWLATREDDNQRFRGKLEFIKADK
jgi:flagellar hook-associated protein FlgK